MARSTYMLKGVSPSTLAARLRQLPAITEQEAAQAASRVCDAAKEVAERECPSGRISFSVVEYGSDKGRPLRRQVLRRRAPLRRRQVRQRRGGLGVPGGPREGV